MFSLSSLFNTFDKCSLAGEIRNNLSKRFWNPVIQMVLLSFCDWKYCVPYDPTYQPIALVFAKKLQSYQAYLYSNQMNENEFLIHNVFKMFCHVSYFMHIFITVCYIATLDANLNCLFKLQWRYTLHIKFPLVPRCHVVINLPILMSARQKQHLLGEW